MTETDRLAAYTLARQQMLEAILLRVIVAMPDAEKTMIKELSRRHIQSRESSSLFQPTSDEELSINSLGREHAFAAVFGEQP